jgi:DNA-binding MarR family transcriptional regulator
VKAALTPVELDAWRGFLQAHARLIAALDAEVEAVHGLALTSYEVLLYLEGAPGRRLRMSELADSLLLSQSGATRLVDRLERDGLVRRERCESDGRGLYAVLTSQGLARLRAARPTHLAGVRRLFLDRLSPEQLRELGRVWSRILEAPAGSEPRSS